MRGAPEAGGASGAESDVESFDDDAGAGGAIFAEINITPLTDIFLVLLIVFMVTSSVFSPSGLGVDLPKSTLPSEGSAPAAVLVTLLPPSQAGQPGRVRVAPGDPFSTADRARLRAELQAALKQAKERAVVVEGDRRAQLGEAVQVMDAARALGVTKLSFATAPGPAPGPDAGKDE